MIKCRTDMADACYCFVVVYKPLSAQMAETLGHRCVRKRTEDSPRSL